MLILTAGKMMAPEPGAGSEVRAGYGVVEEALSAPSV